MFKKNLLFRSSPPDVFLVKGVLKIHNKITGDHLCQSVCSFVKIALRHWCSPVNLLKSFSTLVLRTPLEGYFWSFFFDLRSQRFIFSTTTLRHSVRGILRVRLRIGSFPIFTTLVTWVMQAKLLKEFFSGIA